MPAVFSFVFRSLDSGSRSRTRSREPNRNMLLRIRRSTVIRCMGWRGDWKTKKKSRKERARISTVLLPAEYRECFRERLGRKEYKRKTSIKI